MGLESILRGKRLRPPRIVVYGTEGIGKSTFAAGSPKPIFIPVEEGVDNLDVESFEKPKSFGEVLDDIHDLRTKPHEYSTLVIDTLSALQRLLWDDLCTRCKVESIEDVGGGYGKGYIFAVKDWRYLLDELDRLRSERGMAVILLAHAKVQKFNNPEGLSYDRFVPRLDDRANEVICEWPDALLFASQKVRFNEEDKGFNKKAVKAVAIGKDGGDRILKTTRKPAYAAKHRYNLPEEIPLTWEAFAAGLPQ